MLPRLRGLEGVLGVLSVVLILGAFRPSYALSSEDAERVVQTLKDNGKKRTFNIDGEKITIYRSPLFSLGRRKGRVSYRVSESGPKQLMATLSEMNPIKLGIVTTATCDTSSTGQFDGSVDAYKQITFGADDPAYMMIDEFATNGQSDKVPEWMYTPTEGHQAVFDVVTRTYISKFSK
jgi:hypothetical protein